MLCGVITLRSITSAGARRTAHVDGDLRSDATASDQGPRGVCVGFLARGCAQEIDGDLIAVHGDPHRQPARRREVGVALDLDHVRQHLDRRGGPDQVDGPEDEQDDEQRHWDLEALAAHALLEEIEPRPQVIPHPSSAARRSRLRTSTTVSGR